VTLPLVDANEIHSRAVETFDIRRLRDALDGIRDDPAADRVVGMGCCVLPDPGVSHFAGKATGRHQLLGRGITARARQMNGNAVRHAPRLAGRSTGV
jgi:hypothetical protein